MRGRFRFRWLRGHLRDERGQTFVMVAAAFPVILAIAAVVIDGTRLFVAHQQTQNAADAASLAAGRDLPPTGCTSTPQTCPLGANGKPIVQNDANQYSHYNGGPTIDHACDPLNSADTDCWMTPVVINGVSENIVQVRITEKRNGFFAKAIGLGNLFHVKAIAAATPGSFVAINTTPGTVSPGSTTAITSTTIHTSTSGGAPAIMFAYGIWYPNNAPNAAACNPGGGQSIQINGHNNTFHGTVWSNGGVGPGPGRNDGAPAGDPLGEGFLFYVTPCTVAAPGNWIGQVTQKSQPIDWPVPLPLLTCSAGPPGTSCQAGATPLTVTDNLGVTKTCKSLPSPPNVKIDEPPGVYCSSAQIKLQSNQTQGAAFVGPSVQFNAGTQFSGYTGLYPGYGGLLADGYAPDSVSGGIQSPDSGASTKGAIFAPQGSAKLPGGGTALLCPNSIASCGFWEAVSINLPGDNSTYQGEGPPIGGTVSTTTVLSTTTVTLPGTTSPGSTGTTTLQQQIRLRQ